mmetsp:Transcript_3071/g.4656  ORF Transcript_3071/g.4656 Transcript_3071/m.4656 type:complete len:100 (+) Transcript_3071:130-429(+)
MYRLFVFALAVGTVFSFTATTGPKQITALSAGRRAFLDVSLTAGAATLVGISQPTFAESTDDLSMPSEEEQQVRCIFLMGYGNDLQRCNESPLTTDALE